LIDASGNNVGIVDIKIALEEAHKSGLDLVEIAPTAKPPVARIIDHGKYLYQQEKHAKEKKAKQKTVEMKSIKIGFSISEHDAMTKIKKLEKFLKEGHKVEIVMFLKGRERSKKDFAKERFGNFLKLITAEHKIERPIKQLPRELSIVLSKP